MSSPFPRDERTQSLTERDLELMMQETMAEALLALRCQLRNPDKRIALRAAECILKHLRTVRPGGLRLPPRRARVYVHPQPTPQVPARDGNAK